MSDLVEGLRSRFDEFMSGSDDSRRYTLLDATRDKEAADEIERLQEALIRRGAHWHAPCPVCHYNGPNYYQPDHHNCMAVADRLGIKRLRT